MSERKAITLLLEQLDQLAPMGYAVGLHIRFATPLVYKSSYPAAWVEHYNNHSYYLRDPLVFWGVSVERTTRWSAIPLPDPFGVMKKAAGHGLNYGVVSSYGPISSRSIVGISRSDREFTDEEMATLKEVTIQLHSEAKPPSDLTKAQIEALQCLANGDRRAAAATKLGIIPENSPRLARLVGLDCIPAGPVMDIDGSRSACVSISMVTKMHRTTQPGWFGNSNESLDLQDRHAIVVRPFLVC